MGQTIEASSGDVWQQYYTYDGTNRIAMASENAAITGSTCPTGATWCRQYGYDHFGNRWITPPTDHILHMATPTSQSAISLATNRLTSGTYDAAGNLTAQANITTGGGSMAYDANNKMTSFTATGVSVATKYDAAGRRVRKIHNGQTTIWVYDAFGKLAAEYTTETQTTPVGTYYRTTDHLGSTRLVTDDQGRVRQRHDFFPFGEQIPASASFGDRQDIIDGGFATYNASLSMRQQFTGQQRDGETGLDYFWARNMAAPLGRFLSVDPGNAGASPREAQSWNAYGYAANNPLAFIDPGGAVPIPISGYIYCGTNVETGEPANKFCDSFFLSPTEGSGLHHPALQGCWMGDQDMCAQFMADALNLVPTPEKKQVKFAPIVNKLSRLDPILIKFFSNFSELNGIDFSAVRITELNGPMSRLVFGPEEGRDRAKAVMSNIIISAGNYDQNSLNGMEVLAHELFHVFQWQTRGIEGVLENEERKRDKLNDGSGLTPDDVKYRNPWEMEAYEFGGRVLRFLGDNWTGFYK